MGILLEEIEAQINLETSKGVGVEDYTDLDKIEATVSFVSHSGGAKLEKHVPIPEVRGLNPRVAEATDTAANLLLKAMNSGDNSLRYAIRELISDYFKAKITGREYINGINFLNQ